MQTHVGGIERRVDGGNQRLRHFRLGLNERPWRNETE